MTLEKHSQQTQKQFEAIIANNYENRVQANWPKALAPRPAIVKSEHFSEGDGGTKHHKVRFFYSDGSEQVFDGGSWKVTKQPTRTTH